MEIESIFLAIQLHFVLIYSMNINMKSAVVHPTDRRQSL